MKRLVAVIVVAALVIAASASVVIAQQSPAAGRETLAQALKGAWLPLEHDDGTFTQGWIGLWTKADSVTEFADLEVTGTVAK